MIAAEQATSVIPIVFALAGDPVGAGLIASLARPGGNITGLSLQTTDSANKRIELLREVLPGLRRLAILVNVGNPIHVLEIGEVARQRPVRSASKSLTWKSGEPRTSRPPSKRARPARMRSMSLATRY